MWRGLVGQCDGDDESPRPMSRQTPVVDEEQRRPE